VLTPAYRTSPDRLGRHAHSGAPGVHPVEGFGQPYLGLKRSTEQHRLLCVATSGRNAPEREAAVGRSDPTIGRARRAAGTVVFADFFGRHVLRRSAKRPADDLRDLQAGVAIYVSAFPLRAGRFRTGGLVLDLSAPEPVVWREHRPFRSRGPAIPLPVPFDVEAVGPVLGPSSWQINAHLFRMIILYAGGERWAIAVPTIDVDLVRLALAAANGRQSSTRPP
jgi:hypothetical protein